jgi:hypothetical protein
MPTLARVLECFVVNVALQSLEAAPRMNVVQSGSRCQAELNANPVGDACQQDRASKLRWAQLSAIDAFSRRARFQGRLASYSQNLH